VSHDERAEDRVDELAADPVDVVVVDVAVDALAVGLGKVDDLLLPPVGGLNRRGQRTNEVLVYYGCGVKRRLLLALETYQSTHTPHG